MRAISILCLVSAAGAALAVAPFAAAESLVIPIDHAMRVSVQGSAASVIIGNAAVADVSVVDTHTLFISGKSIGQTDVSVLDGFGRTIYASDVDVTAFAPGRVAVFRGPDRTDFACAPGCSPQTHGPAAAAAPPAPK
jgi:Flp pilus assembly secretin CpaC